MQQLYEPLIERDLAAIPAAVRRFRETHSSEELFVAIARFVLLAYAPSQHAKHALVAALAVYELREELGAQFDEAVTELAIYAAASRQPWSEPPILEPPPLDAAQRSDRRELLAAIAAGDRHRAERWLAKRIADADPDGDLAGDYFAAAAEDLADLGHKLIVTAAAWRLVLILGEGGRYATLRVGVWELTAYRGAAGDGSAVVAPTMTTDTAPADGVVEATLAALVDEAIATRGELEAMHAVFLLEAAITASSIAGDPSIVRRVVASFVARPNAASRSASSLNLAPSLSASAASAPTAGAMVYRYARDYAQCLIAHAVAKRLRAKCPALPLDAFVAAAHDHLEHAPSFEDWSFA
jgi:hypothetical protein